MYVYIYVHTYIAEAQNKTSEESNCFTKAYYF